MKIYDFFVSNLTHDTTLTKYGLPLLRNTSTDIPENIIPFDKLKYFNKKQISNSYICFYCQDQSFIKIFKNPKKYIGTFKKAQGIIGFDLSVFEDMPSIIQKEILFKNLSLTNYYSMKGISVIPNLRFGSDDTIKPLAKSFPKHMPICIGTYGFINSAKEKENWRTFLVQTNKLIHPSIYLVYGSAPKDVFTREIMGEIPYKVYPSYKSLRMKEVFANECNKRTIE